MTKPTFIDPFDNADSTKPAFVDPFETDAATSKPEPKSGTIRRAIGDTALTALKSTIAVPEIAVGLADLVSGGRAGKFAEEAGFKPKQAKEFISDFYSPEQKLANQKVQEADGFIDTAKTALQYPSTIFHTTLESLGGMGVGGLGARGLMAVAPKVAPFVAGAIGEGLVTAGQNAEQLRQETDDGLLTGKQAAITAGSGALTGLISGASGSIAKKLGIADIDTLIAEGKLAGKATGLPKAIAGGVISEGLLEEMPQSAQEQIAQNLSLDKPWDEGVGNAAAMGALSGGLMGGGANVLNAFGGKDNTQVTPPPAPPAPEGSLTSAATIAQAVGLTPQPVMPDATEAKPNIVDSLNAVEAQQNGVMPDAAIAPIEPAAIAPEQAAEKQIIDEQAQQAATSPLNDLPQPTEKQVEAGNYKKGHIKYDGLNITVENPQGSTRSGTDEDGKPWSNTLQHHYGYIKRTKGNDGDNLDVFIGDKTKTGKVFVINQTKKDGSFDEHKAVLGAETADEAIAIYKANYADDWNSGKSVTELTTPAFKDWLKNGDPTKPLETVSATSNDVDMTKVAVGEQVDVGGVPYVKTENGFERVTNATENVADATSVDTTNTLPERVDETANGVQVPAIRKGEVGSMLAAKEVVTTASGRTTTPFPNFNGKDGKVSNFGLKAVDKWLVDNAIAEAESRNDDFNLTQFKAINLKNLSQADKDGAEEYLFGSQPAVVPSILKPLVTETAITPKNVNTETTTPVNETAQPADTVRPLVEQLTKLRATADKHPSFDPALKAAKDFMAGKKVSPRQFKNFANLLGKKNKAFREVLMQLHDQDASTPEQLAAKEKKSKLAKAMLAERMKLDTTKDGLMQAMAKLGGLNADKAKSEFGIDPADMRQHGAGIKRSFNKNGLDADTMRELLLEQGYPVGESVADLGNAIADAMSGIDVLTAAGQEALAQKKYEEYANAISELTDDEQALLDELVTKATAKYGAEAFAEIDASLAESMKGQPQVEIERALLRMLKEEFDDETGNAGTSQATEGQAGQDTETGSIETGSGRAQQNGTNTESQGSDTSQVSARKYTPPASVKEASDRWKAGFNGEGFVKPELGANQTELMAVVQKAIDAGLFYNREIDAFVAKELNITPAELEVGKNEVEGGAFGYDVYLAKQEVQKNNLIKANVEQAKKLKLSIGENIGKLKLSDGKIAAASTVTKLDDSFVTLTAKRGSQTISFTTDYLGVTEYAKRADNNYLENKVKLYADLLGDNTAAKPDLELTGQTNEDINAGIAAQEVEARAQQEQAKSDEAARIEAERKSRQEIAADSFDLTQTGKDAKSTKANDAKVIDNQFAGQGDLLTPPAEQPKPETKAATVALKDTSDVGIEMLGNRRNKGLTLKDIQDANNDTERVAMAVKTKLWERPDYQALVDSGVQPAIAHIVKQIYDGLSSKPAYKGEKMLYDYVNVVEATKKAVDEFLSDKNAMARMITAVAVKAKKQSWMLNSNEVIDIANIGNENDTDIENYLNYFVDRVFPKNESGARWGRQNKEGNNKANATGNRFYKNIQLNLSSFIDAMKAVQQGFPAKQEAWQRSYQIKEADGKFQVIKKGRYSPKSEHATREEAEDAARALVKREREEAFKEPETPVEKSIRKGRELRANGNVSSQELQDAVGLKAVNFGDWMKKPSNAKERQSHVNSAFDAFHDLAEVVNLPVNAMSLDGMLGLAIGAQGKGKAAAHFYPGYNEINLTREKGAGSLAHEWAHGLDHYFGVQAGLATSENPFASWNGRYRAASESDIRPEVADAFNTIVESMRSIQETPEAAKERITATAQASKERIEQFIERNGLKEAVKDDETAQKALDEIIAGETGDYVEWPALKGKRKPQGYISEYVKYIADKLGWNFDRAHDFGLTLAGHSASQEALKTEPILRKIHTDYYRAASIMDGSKEKAYWSTPHELFARAFEMYVAEKIANADGRNDYLVAAWKQAEEINTGDQLIDDVLNEAKKRYPQGKEREAINAAFDVLFNEIKTKETDKGIALYQNKEEYGNYGITEKQRSELTEPERRAYDQSAATAIALRGVKNSVLGLAVSKDFKQSGSTSLLGKQIATPEDLAVAAQVYRDPRFETVRYFFIKEGSVISQTSVTSKLAGVATLSPNVNGEGVTEFISEIATEAANLGADGVYLLHNHPDGNPTPSKVDMTATKFIQGILAEKNIDLLGHVIINHQKYAVIDRENNQKVIERKFENTYSNDNPAVPHAILGKVISDQYDLAEHAKAIEFTEGNIVLIGTSGMSGISVITEIEPADLKPLKLAAILRKLSRQSGAESLFAYNVPINLSNLAAKAIKNSILVDAITTDTYGNKQSLRSFIDPDDNVTMGRPLKGYVVKQTGVNENYPVDIKYSRPQSKFSQKSTGIDIRDLNAVVANVNQALRGLPATYVLEDYTKAPAELVADIKRDKAYDAAGAWHNGEIYLFRNNIINTNHALFTMLHESTHEGLRRVFGKEIDATLMGIYLSNKDIKQQADALRATHKDLSLVGSVEESLADMGGNDIKASVMDKLVAFVRNVLRRLGMNLTVSDGEVRTLVTRALDSLKSPSKVTHYTIGSAYSAASSGDQTNTPEFKAWFGDSKVVDADGKPLVVYHGSNSNFDTFFTNGINNLAYFTTNKKVAKTYGKNVRAFYLKIENLNEHDFNGNWWKNNYGAAESLVGSVDTKRYDGLLFKNTKDPKIFDSEKDFPISDIYAVKNPAFIKSATDNNGDFDPNNPDIRYSRPTPRLSPVVQPTTPNQQWQNPDKSKLDNVIYMLQNKFVDLKRVTQAIQKSGNTIEDKWNPYLLEENFTGRTAKRTKDFLKQELEPLMKSMQARKVEMADFEEYLWARHAEERNIQIAKINPAMQDGGSGMTTQDARDYLANLTPVQSANYQALAAKVDAILKTSRQRLISYGLETPETIAAWEGAYQHYVPLMREDMDNGFGNGSGQGFSVKGNASKRATGSKRAVVDVLANIAQQVERNIIHGEKNRVSTALVGLATLNPNKDFWKVDVVPKMRTVVAGKNTYEVLYNGSVVQTFTNPVEANKFIQWNGAGYTLNIVKGQDLVMDVPDPSYKNRDNIVVARIVNAKGKIEEHFVEFNTHDERAMRAAASIKNLDQDQIGELLGTAASITRYFSSINTQYNPFFGVINILRDVQGSLLNLSSTPLAGKQLDVLKNTPLALKGIYQDIRSERKTGTPTNSYWSLLFEDFQKQGGQTGYRDMFRNAKERGEALKHALDPSWWQQTTAGKIVTINGILAKPEQFLKEAGQKYIFDWLSDYNESMENAVRLSAYKVALDNGMTKAQAASLAKNISVNFNRKGEMGRQIGSLYAFFNASVQGTARIGETLFTDNNGKLTLSKAGKAIVTGGLLLGVMQALMLAAAGFGDDEPPEFVRDRNLIIPLGNGKAITIAMPLGFNALPAFGRILTEWALSGGEDTSKRFFHIFEMLAEVTNPIGNAGLSMQTITPTMFDPLAALAENKDWTGRPIAKMDFNSQKPTAGHTRAKDTASAISKGLSWLINEATGGSDYTPGALSPTPDQIDYLLGQIFGGVGREYMKLEQSATSIVTGEDLPVYKIPLVGRFYLDAEGQSSQSSRFYDNLKSVFETETELKGLRKDGLDTSEYRANHPEAALVFRANLEQREISKMYKLRSEKLKADASPEEIKALNERITARMLKFNELFKTRTTAGE